MTQRTCTSCAIVLYLLGGNARETYAQSKQRHAGHHRFHAIPSRLSPTERGISRVRLDQGRKSHTARAVCVLFLLLLQRAFRRLAGSLSCANMVAAFTRGEKKNLHASEAG